MTAAFDRCLPHDEYVRLGLVWRATYQDGSQALQLDYDGTEHPTSDIDRRRLARFALIDPKTGVVVVSIDLKPGYRLVYRRRTALSSTGRSETHFLVGWAEPGVADAGRHVLLDVCEQSRVVRCREGFDVANVWFAPIEPVEADSVTVANSLADEG